MCNVVALERWQAHNIERSVDGSEFELAKRVILSGRIVNDVVFSRDLEPPALHFKVDVREVSAAC